MSPAAPLTLTPTAPGKTCAFGANCNCVFIRVQPAVRPALATPLETEVANWTDLGFTVVEATDAEVLLERPKKLPFCFDLGLCVVTAGLWLLRWVPAMRHPRFDTRRVAVSADGSIAVEQGVVRR